MGASDQQLAEALEALKYVRRRSARFVVTEASVGESAALSDIHEIATRTLTRLGGVAAGASEEQSTLPGV